MKDLRQVSKQLESLISYVTNSLSFLQKFTSSFLS